jgi:hypothetical protein
MKFYLKKEFLSRVVGNLVCFLIIIFSVFFTLLFVT